MHCTRILYLPLTPIFSLLSIRRFGRVGSFYGVGAGGAAPAGCGSWLLSCAFLWQWIQLALRNSSLIFSFCFSPAHRLLRPPLPPPEVLDGVAAPFASVGPFRIPSAPRLLGQERGSFTSVTSVTHIIHNRRPIDR